MPLKLGIRRAAAVTGVTLLLGLLSLVGHGRHSSAADCWSATTTSVSVPDTTSTTLNLPGTTSTSICECWTVTADVDDPPPEVTICPIP